MPRHDSSMFRASRSAMKFGIFIYDGVEPIDLATFGVLSMARRIRPDIEITTLAPAAGPVKLSNGLVVMADHALGAAPKLDVLIVTGGPGWQEESKRPETLSALRQRASDTLLVSVDSTAPMSRAWASNLEKFPPLAAS